MKHYYSYWLLALLCLFSCQPDDSELSQSIPLDNVPIANVIVDSDGQSHFAGFGYDRARGKPYNMAIQSSDVILYNGSIDQPWRVRVRAVESRDSLIAFLGRGFRLDVGFGGEPAPGGGEEDPPPGDEEPLPLPLPESVMAQLADGDNEDEEETPRQKTPGGESPSPLNIKDLSARLEIINSLEEAMSFGENKINVIAQIEVAYAQYYVNDNPTLTPEAQALAESDPTKFFGVYGTEIVSANLLGGELYVVYSLEVSETSRVSKRGNLFEAELALKNIFNIDVGNQDSVAEISTSYRKVLSTEVISTVPNYTPPAVIMDEAQANDEAARLLDYLKANPENAQSLDKAFLPYAAFVRNPEFVAEWDRRRDCYDNYYDWALLASRIKDISREGSYSAELRDKAKYFLSQVERDAELARACVSVGDPARYQDILDQAAQEASEGQTMSVYRYYSQERTNSYYTTDPASVKNIDGSDSYELVGVEWRIFADPREGTTWLKEYWHNANDDHRYNTEPHGVGESNGYQYTRDLGYILKDNGDLGDDVVRPLYIYYNDEVADHLLTTDPEKESFGSRQGGDGYRFMGTLGYVLPPND